MSNIVISIPSMKDRLSIREAFDKYVVSKMKGICRRYGLKEKMVIPFSAKEVYEWSDGNPGLIYTYEITNYDDRIENAEHEHYTFLFISDGSTIIEYYNSCGSESNYVRLKYILKYKEKKCGWKEAIKDSVKLIKGQGNAILKHKKRLLKIAPTIK